MQRRDVTPAAALIAALFLTLSTVPVVRAAGETPASPPEGGLEVLYHADLDGELAPLPCDGTKSQAPAYSALIAALAERRARAAAEGAPAPLVLLGGNIAAPGLVAQVLLRRADGLRTLAAIIGAAGYDAVALGHHDLALEVATLDGLVKSLAGSGVPVVTTNVACDPAVRTACASLRREVVVRRGDQAVGVLAIISPTVQPAVPADHLVGLRLEEPTTAIKDAVRRLRAQGVTAIVLMTQGTRGAAALNEIDSLVARLPREDSPQLILAGGLADPERERPLRALERDGGAPVVGSPGLAGGMAQVRLGRAPGGASPSRADWLSPSATQVEPRIAAMLSPHVAATCAQYGQAVSPGPVRGTLTRDDFVAYVLEIVRRRADAEIALVNRNFVKRTPFPVTGPFTRAALFRALPYRAAIGRARLTGGALESLLAPVLENPKLAIVGAERRDGKLWVNGRALDRARDYSVATISFVARGGDALFPAGALPWRPLDGEPDVRDTTEAFLRTATAARDHDVSLDPRTDFGAPAVQRLLIVGITDIGLDLASTSIRNGPGYDDAQLTRTRQRAIKGDAVGLLQLRQATHEGDARLNVKYGWARNTPPGGAAVAGETADLVRFAAVYNYRGLRENPALPRRAVPDPYLRVGIDSELTRPAVTPGQRDYHHLQLTTTAGALFTVASAARVRGGAGARKELLAAGDAGRVLPMLEAGATLTPVALATFRALAMKLEGLIDYAFIDPWGSRRHELRGSGRLSLPLLPLLFLTGGVDVFAAQRTGRGWGVAYDTTIGLRVHLDAAHQRL